MLIVYGLNEVGCYRGANLTACPSALLRSSTYNFIQKENRKLEHNKFYELIQSMLRDLKSPLINGKLAIHRGK